MLLGDRETVLLRVEGLDVAYGQAKALHGVSIELRQGEMVFIVGRNGAGKTTLLKTIAGLMKPAEGSVVFMGEDVIGLPPEKVAQRGIAYVAQDKKVFSQLTVRDNLELAAFAAGMELEQALDIATTMYPDFKQRMHVKAGSLSGGQREILLIARALFISRRLLMIDEPTEGLASIVIEEIFRILVNTKQQKRSAIIVEQNLGIVKRLADRIYVMKEGRVIKVISDPSDTTATAELESLL
ncbi:MAG: ABC transporter ATP-binding protein [Thermodesulfobacteriota bacterium]